VRPPFLRTPPAAPAGEGKLTKALGGQTYDTFSYNTSGQLGQANAQAQQAYVMPFTVGVGTTLPTTTSYVASTLK
jgi:hypothetical protein